MPLMMEGRVVVGEAKVSNVLDRANREVRRVAAKLAEAAIALTADDVYLVTATSEWKQGSVDLVRQALQATANRAHVRPPSLHCLAGAHGTWTAT